MNQLDPNNPEHMPQQCGCADQEEPAESPRIHLRTHVPVDWDKVTTLDDLKRIIKELDPHFSSSGGAHGQIKDLLKQG